MKRIISLGIITIFLSGCSYFGDDNKSTVAPQPVIQNKVNIQTIWDIKPVSGNTKQYNKNSPTFSMQEIVLASEKGKIVTVDKSSGKVISTINTKMQLSSLPTYGQQQFLVGTTDGKLLAINAKTGKQQWQYAVSDQVVAKPAYANNIVAVKTLDGKLFALNSRNGKMLWQYNEGNPELILKGESDPVIYDGMLITGFPDGKMVVLNLTTGGLVWEAQVAESQGFSTLARMVDLNTTPVVRDGMIYIGSYQGNISAYSLNTGHRIWEHKLSTYSGLTVDNKNVYVTDANGVLWAFNKNTGSVNWKQKVLQGYALSAPATYQSYILLGDNLGNLQVFTKKDGEPVARVKLSSKPIYVAPIINNGAIYVFSSDGQLTKLSIK